MKRLMTAVGALSLVGLLGCGAPDFGSLKKDFDSPSGTFAGNESQALQAATSVFSNTTTVTALAPTGTLGSPLLSGVTSLTGWCPELTSETGSGKGSCQCPDGGSIDFDIADVKGYLKKGATPPTGPIDAELSLKATACTFIDERAAAKPKLVGDGAIYAKVQASSVNPVSDDLFALLSVHASVKGTTAQESKELKVDADAMFKNKILYVSVQVKDGKVAVGVSTGGEGFDTKTKTGTVYVLAKGGSYTCKLTNGAGTCTNDQTGEVRNVGA